MMAYDKLRPLRASLKAGTKLAQAIPDMLPYPGTKRAIQQTVPMRGSDPAPMRLARDPLYRVERRIYFWYSDHSAMTWFHSLEDAQSYVQGVLVNYREAFSRADWPLTFKETNEYGAWYQGGVVTVPLPVQRMALLHELTHHLVGTEVGHDATFTAAYMTLVRVEIGDEIADRFISEMTNP